MMPSLDHEVDLILYTLLVSSEMNSGRLNAVFYLFYAERRNLQNVLFQSIITNT